MTDKKNTEELNEQELDQVTGGVAETSGLSKIKKGAGIRAVKDPGKGGKSGIVNMDEGETI